MARHEITEVKQVPLEEAKAKAIFFKTKEDIEKMMRDASTPLEIAGCLDHDLLEEIDKNSTALRKYPLALAVKAAAEAKQAHAKRVIELTEGRVIELIAAPAHTELPMPGHRT